MYLWAVVAAHDLGLISESRADQLASSTLHEVAKLKRYDGFLYQWYDTNNGNVLSNPGQGDCTETTPTQDNCWFVSAVDNGWYATGLIEVKQALPALRGLADVAAEADGLQHLLRQPAADRLQRQRVARATSRRARCTAASTSTRDRPATTTARCTATPGSRCTSGWGATRCPATCGGGRGGPRRRSAAATDPANSATATGTGYWHTYTDPQSGKKFPVWEGHYTYPGTSLTFVPTFAGGMFEGLMANLVVPETTWGPHSFGPRRSALGPGPGEVRDPGARLPGVGDVAVLDRG